MPSSTVLKLLPFGISAAGVGLAYVFIIKDCCWLPATTKPLYEERRDGKNSGLAGGVVLEKARLVHFWVKSMDSHIMKQMHLCFIMTIFGSDV